MFDTARGRWVLLICLASCAGAFGQSSELLPLLGTNEQAAVVEALRCLKMTPADLSYKKDYSDAPFRLERVQRFLELPLELPRYANQSIMALTTNQCPGPWSLLAFASSAVELDRSAAELSDSHLPMWKDGFPAAFPAQLHNCLRGWIDTIRIADSTLSARVFGGISRAQRQRAVARFAVENLRLEADAAEADAWGKLGIESATIRDMLAANDRLETADDAYASDLLPVFRNVQYADMIAAASILSGLYNEISNCFADPEMRKVISPDTIIKLDTRLGPIFIGGTGPTHYTEDALLIIDLGGDDTYDCHAGAANGLIDRPISIVIDLAGNDRYRSGSLAQGAGVFGIGILVDCAGDDTYEGKHLCQGAGLFGVGILADYGGDDWYDCDIHGQGAGIFGVGILWNRNGDDRYVARQSSQGFGYTGGCGLLLDGAGNDIYYAGGKYSDHERLPEHYLSCSQGFGYGMRPDASGGVGILCDLAGNDVYTTDIYGQGVGYFYGLGMLLDAGGHDVYRCHQYGQGAGIHLATGILADWKGDDLYVGHALVQGIGHDWSVGMLFDKEGNDKYAAESTAQGSALYNSTALLVDSAGNDLYASPVGSNTQAAGHDGERREYGSIALLLDLAGKDGYMNGPRDDFIALKPSHGCALDENWTDERGRRLRPPTGSVFGIQAGRRAEAPPTFTQTNRFASTPTEISRPRDDRERAWLKLIRQSTLYPDTEKKAREKALAYEILRRDGAAVLPFWLRQLDHDALMVRVRLDEFIDEVGATNAAPALLEALESPNELIRRNACYYVGKLKVTGAVELLRGQLAHEKVRPIALWTLGELKARCILDEAPKYLDDSNESTRMRAAAALGKLGDARAVPVLIEKLDDELWNVRYVAQAALVRIGKPSVQPMLRALPKAPDRARPHLIEALGRVGDWRTANALRPYLRVEDSLVRGTTVAAIAQIKPRWWRSEQERLRRIEQDLFVRSRLDAP